MNIEKGKLKNFILSTLNCGFGMWLLAGFWHKVIMVQFYSRETHATHEGTGIILLAYMILAALMVYLYSRIQRSERRVVDGLAFGMVMGLLWVFPHELAMAGAHGDSLSYVFINAAWHMIEQGVGGLILVLVYRDKSAL